MKKFIFLFAFILATLLSICYSTKVESLSKNNLKSEKYGPRHHHGAHYPYYGHSYGKWHHRGHHPGYWGYYPSYPRYHHHHGKNRPYYY
jgi:hypothetical protein